MPKEVRVEPQKFAAELIHRLEAVQRTREAEEELEERLKRVRMVSGCRGAGCSRPLRHRPLWSWRASARRPGGSARQGWRPASCSAPSVSRGARMASLGQGGPRL